MAKSLQLVKHGDARHVCNRTLNPTNLFGDVGLRPAQEVENAVGLSIPVLFVQPARRLLREEKKNDKNSGDPRRDQSNMIVGQEVLIVKSKSLDEEYPNGDEELVTVAKETSEIGGGYLRYVHLQQFKNTLP